MQLIGSRNNNQHRIRLEVDGKDKRFNDRLSSDLVKVQIVNSIHNIYPVIELTIMSDNEYIMNNQFYGQDLITIKIQLIANNDGDPIGSKSLNEIVIQLLYIEGNLDLSPKSEHNGINLEDKIRDRVVITTIPFPSYATANKIFNKIYEEPCSKTPFNIIHELLQERDIDDKYIEKFGENESKINQLIIPPMEFHRVIKYINDKFGIYKGPLFSYFDYTGQFLMWDLYEKIKKYQDSPAIEFYKFPSHFDDNTLSDEIQKKVFEHVGKIFIIFGKIKTLYYSNSKMLVHGYNNIFITYPHESLYQLSVITTDDVIENQGIYNKNNKLTYHKDINKMRTYRTNQIGFEKDGYSGEYDQTAMVNKISQFYRNNFTIRFIIDVHVWAQHLFHVGQPIGINILTDYEQNIDSDYGGSYILDHTDVIFDKSDGSDNYTSHCIVTASRSVLTRK